MSLSQIDSNTVMKAIDVDKLVWERLKSRIYGDDLG